MPKKLYIKNDATLSVTSFQTVEKPLAKESLAEFRHPQMTE